MNDSAAHIVIRELKTEDFNEWLEPAIGYKEFYNTPTTHDEFLSTWERILARRDVFALVAVMEGKVVGIAHYLFHATVWQSDSCYLQDLFTRDGARGNGSRGS